MKIEFIDGTLVLVFNNGEEIVFLPTSNWYNWESKDSSLYLDYGFGRLVCIWSRNNTFISKVFGFN